MGIKADVQLAPLVTALALAPSLVFAGAPVQDHIVLTMDAGGRPIYVNASDPGDSRVLLRSRATSLAQGPASLRVLAARTARTFQVDPRLVDAVIDVESGYDPGARSPKGALGLMQLMPATITRYGVRDAFDPALSLQGGVSYLSHLLELFHGDVPRSLAAYNAGEDAVERVGGIPPFAETRDYVRKVMARYGSGNVGVPTASTKGEAKSGLDARAPGAPDNAVSRVPIYRYVDAEGVVHFVQ